MIPVSEQSVLDRHLGVLYLMDKMTCNIIEPK